MKKLWKNRQGFTLVELMVVVAIMGVLIAIAVPAYNNATAGAEAATCKSNMRTYDSAAMQAVMAGATLTDGNLDAVSDGAIDNLNTYMKGGQPVYCPSDKAKESPYSIEVDGNDWTIVCNGPNADEHNEAAADTTTTP